MQLGLQILGLASGLETNSREDSCPITADQHSNLCSFCSIAKSCRDLHKSGTLQFHNCMFIDIQCFANNSLVSHPLHAHLHKSGTLQFHNCRNLSAAKLLCRSCRKDQNARIAHSRQLLLKILLLSINANCFAPNIPLLLRCLQLARALRPLPLATRLLLQSDLACHACSLTAVECCQLDS